MCQSPRKRRARAPRSKNLVLRLCRGLRAVSQMNPHSSSSRTPSLSRRPESRWADTAIVGGLWTDFASIVRSIDGWTFRANPTVRAGQTESGVHFLALTAGNIGPIERTHGQPLPRSLRQCERTLTTINTSAEVATTIINSGKSGMAT
jgi:hypothetical protein